jgi:hypothetical protein
MDAMALVRKYGKTDVFLTMTCNPNWDEITQHLYHGQSPQDRPDLIVHVFRAKLEELKNLLFKKHILGKVKARVYVVEFQKRGLPHAHFLLIMEQRYKLTCSEQYDHLICAELPDKAKYPLLYKMVTKHMMHSHVVSLIQIYRAQRVVPLARITIHAHSTKQPYRGRTPTYCIEDEKTVVKKWLGNMRWIIDG